MNINNDLQARFNAVQEAFPPDSCSVSLNLESNAGFEETAKDYVSALERLDAYVKNGNSTKGLPFSYSNIEVY